MLRLDRFWTVLEDSTARSVPPAALSGWRKSSAHELGRVRSPKQKANPEVYGQAPVAFHRGTGHSPNTLS